MFMLISPHYLIATIEFGRPARQRLPWGMLTQAAGPASPLATVAAAAAAALGS